MKILLLHSDFIEWEPKKKAIKQAEKVEKKVSNVKDVLVVFSAVEKTDEGKEKIVIENTSKEIEKVRKEVKAKNVVVYPYVHLSTNPSSPSTALNVLKGVESYLKKMKISVYRAPFGYYKRFKISVKGHPLSELSREIVPEKEAKVSEAVKKEKELRSEWYVMDTGGKLHKLSIEKDKLKGFDFSKNRNLEKLILHEMTKSRKVEEEPPHVKLMRKLELVDYESASDPGNFRFLPAGKLIKSLLEDFVTKKMVEYGAMEVETPIMYDYEHPALKDYLNRFPARQYTIETPNKRVFLRFSACFGQFILSHDANISYRNLPMKIYEMASSFRVEQRGELAGLRRLRSFSMSDIHGLCRDITQAKEEFIERFKLAKDVQQCIGLDFKNDFEFSLRVVKDFYEKNKEFVKEVVKMMKKPVLIEVWDKKFFYFIFKMEWNFVDALGKASCLTTDQIDVENAKRYGIKFMDKDNKMKYPVILHMSPSGSIERVMYTLLEKAYIELKRGKNPTLPLWLTPTQVRLIPVSEKFLTQTKRIANEISKENIRVDIDDRNETVEKKIRDSEVNWVPFAVVIGRKELKDKKLAVRFRKTGKVKRLSKKKLTDMIKKETKGMPFKALSLPRLLTRRPTFIG